MYKRYLHKYFLNFNTMIDRATIDFQKHRSCNRDNTIPGSIQIMSWGEILICLIQSKVVLMKNPTRSWLPQSIMDGIFNEPCKANSLTPLPSINTVP